MTGLDVNHSLIHPSPPIRFAQLFFRSNAHLKFNPFKGNQVRLTFNGFARRMMKTFSAEKYRLVCSLRLGKIFEQRFVCAWLEEKISNIIKWLFSVTTLKTCLIHFRTVFLSSRSRQIFHKSILAGTFSIVMRLCIHIVLQAVQSSHTLYLSRPSSWVLNF